MRHVTACRCQLAFSLAIQLSLLLWVTGCQEGTVSGAIDGSLPVDRGLSLDQGPSTPPDAGPPQDAGTPQDGGTVQDTGAPEADAGLPQDIGAPLPCDKRFGVPPQPIDAAKALAVSFSDTSPYVYIGLEATGPGSPATSFDGVSSTGTPKTWTWSYQVTGHAAGVLSLTFTRDNGTPVGSCQLRVVGQGGPATDGGTACTPSCAGVICGGDDGCGTPCSGGYRDLHGGVSDCRLAGDCGCGKEDNGNMECTGGGKCRVRCPCDCLPPQDLAPASVAGLDRAGACTMVFKNSGDPTVWDAASNAPLCPVAQDPQGVDRCTLCPPCHRDHPPACSWSAWCTCSDPRWYSDYSNQCCAAGAQFCY